MKTTLDETSFPTSLPLALYETCRIGTIETDAGQVFKLVLGLDAQGVAQLKTLSCADDPALRENTSDYERFGIGSYEEWYAKGRSIFALLDETNDALAAIVWYGPKPFGRKSLKHLPPGEQAREKESVKEAGDWHTIVVRSYPPYRGTGIMTGFVQETLNIYKKYFPSARVWAGINGGNAGSIRLFEKLGFTRSEEISTSEWVGMVL
jgi:RimJ/RimL family protein N-acetyltransferase